MIFLTESLLLNLQTLFMGKTFKFFLILMVGQQDIEPTSSQLDLLQYKYLIWVSVVQLVQITQITLLLTKSALLQIVFLDSIQNKQSICLIPTLQMIIINLHLIVCFQTPKDQREENMVYLKISLSLQTSTNSISWIQLLTPYG